MALSDWEQHPDSEPLRCALDVSETQNNLCCPAVLTASLQHCTGVVLMLEHGNHTVGVQ